MNAIRALRSDLRLSEMSQLLGALSGLETYCRNSVGSSGSRIRLPPHFSNPGYATAASFAFSKGHL